MADIIEIKDTDFTETVVNAKGLTVVDFFAPWCGPCRKLSDIISQIADDFAGRVKIYKLNTDENIETAKQYSVSSLPTILIFKDGESVERLVGLVPKSSIVTHIEKHL